MLPANPVVSFLACGFSISISTVRRPQFHVTGSLGALVPTVRYDRYEIVRTYASELASRAAAAAAAAGGGPPGPGSSRAQQQQSGGGQPLLPFIMKPCYMYDHFTA